MFKRAGQVGRPCLLGYIDKCSAPCVGRVTPEEHRAIAEDFCDFMAGNTTRFVKRLERDMAAASKSLEFEQAARLRDDLVALGKALEKSAIVLGDGTDADVFALERRRARGRRPGLPRARRAGARAARLGRRDGRRDASPRSSATSCSRSTAASPVTACRARCSCRCCPTDPTRSSSWLGSLRGSGVDLRVPQRGDKRTLLETVHRNAKQSLARHKLARAGDLTARSQALQELQTSLDLADAPLRVECYDISHIQGSQVVGSMVVFEDGLARKSEYRRFVIRGEQVGRHRGDGRGADPAVPALPRGARPGHRRRARRPTPRAGPERIDPDTGKPKKFAYPPNLVVVDGGLPQVNAAHAALTALGIDDVAVVGLAKRLEEVWVPGQDYPVILPRTSEGLYLLQRVRDEAHRFAITFHRQRRSKAMTTQRPRRHPRPGGDPAQGAAAALRLGEEGPRGHGRGAAGGFRHRTCAGGHDCGRVGHGRHRRPRRQPDDRRDPRR